MRPKPLMNNKGFLISWLRCGAEEREVRLKSCQQPDMKKYNGTLSHWTISGSCGEKCLEFVGEDGMRIVLCQLEWPDETPLKRVSLS